MATKNNLDVGGEAPVHKDLAARYRIDGNVYDLGQIVAAVKGEQSDEDWNARTLTDRLAAIKTYIGDMSAEKVEDTENTAGDGTVKDGEGNVLETAGQAAGSTGGVQQPEPPTQQEADQNEETANELADTKHQLGVYSEGYTSALAELGMSQYTFDDIVEAANDPVTAGIRGLKDRMSDVRGALGIREEDDVIEAVKDQQKALTDTEQRATVAEQDASHLRQELKTLREKATRGPALHGFVDELKAPY